MIARKEALATGKAEHAGRRRRRPGDLQREQKETNRQNLLLAARDAFEARSYSATSIDDIVDRAGVSRTSFYRHFDSKLDVVIALFEVVRPILLERWQLLLNDSRPSLKKTTTWLRRYLATIEADATLGSVLREVMVLEPKIQENGMQFYEILLTMMWGDAASDRAHPSPKIWARSLLLLLQMDECLTALCARKWTLSRDGMIEAMSEILNDFLALRQKLNSEGLAPEDTAEAD